MWVLGGLSLLSGIAGASCAAGAFRKQRLSQRVTLAAFSALWIGCSGLLGGTWAGLRAFHAFAGETLRPGII